MDLLFLLWKLCYLSIWHKAQPTYQVDLRQDQLRKANTCILNLKTYTGMEWNVFLYIDDQSWDMIDLINY